MLTENTSSNDNIAHSFKFVGFGSPSPTMPGIPHKATNIITGEHISQKICANNMIGNNTTFLIIFILFLC